MTNATEMLDLPRVIDKLRFPHSVTELRLLETHISWVILTGDFAYKIKKPVDLGFVDYSTLEKRQHFCQRELELNRRFAPELYLEVAAITSDDGMFTLLNECDTVLSGGVIEYAVKMRQFPHSAIVASRLNDPGLDAICVEDFGRRLAKFHANIETIDSNRECVQPSQIMHDADENYDVLCNSKLGEVRCEKLRSLQKCSALFEQRLKERFSVRLESGKTKRCHGDLHLKNLIQIDGRLIPFDGIEFNEQFQCIDVLSEIAFPVMDFVARKRSDLGWRLLNAYLEATNEYGDFAVLRFYLLHRSMVRAKVAWLNPGNHTPERRREYAPAENPTDSFAGPWDKYLFAADYFAFSMKPKLSISHGFSGSGKSTAAMKTIDQEGGIRIRSDILRHQLANETPKIDKYSSYMDDAVYDRLASISRRGIEAGFPVIADASFLKIDRRTAFRELAVELNVPFEIIDSDAPFSELCRRLKNRTNDPSEATVEVLNHQLSNHEPLTVEEKAFIRAQ